MSADDHLLAQGTVDARTEERLFQTGRDRKPLTDRQTYALRVIRDQQPIRSDALGAHLHAYRKANGGAGHLPDESCDWCVSDGKSVGDALAKKGLVRYLRGLGWATVSFVEVAPGKWEERVDGEFVRRHATTKKAEKESSQLGVGDPWPDDLF